MCVCVCSGITWHITINPMQTELDLLAICLQTVHTLEHEQLNMNITKQVSCVVFINLIDHHISQLIPMGSVLSRGSYSVALMILSGHGSSKFTCQRLQGTRRQSF